MRAGMEAERQAWAKEQEREQEREREKERLRREEAVVRKAERKGWADERQAWEREMQSFAARFGHLSSMIEGFSVDALCVGRGDVRGILYRLRGLACHAEVYCTALMKLAVQKDNQKVMALAGGIELVLDMLRGHTGHAGLQETGCRVLVNLASDNKDNQKAIADAGGIEAVVHTMRGRSGHAAKVQEAGCCALAILASENKENQKAIGAGGIEAVIGAMRRHTGDVGVQSAGCRALAKLSFGDKDNQRATAIAGGIGVVVSAMRAHAGHNDDRDAAPASAGGVAGWAWRSVSRISKVLRGFPMAAPDGTASADSTAGTVRSTELHEAGCSALARLAFDDKDNQKAIADAGGIEAVVDAMRENKGHAGMQVAGCRALVNLASDNRDNQKTIVDAGGIEAVGDAMRENKGHAGMQLARCKALLARLVNLASDDKNDRKAVADAGKCFIEALQPMKDFPNHESLEDCDTAVRVCFCSLRVLYVCLTHENCAGYASY